MPNICGATGFDLDTTSGVAQRDDTFIETVEKGDIVLLKHMLDNGVHPDTSNLHGTTGLMKAGRMGFVPVMELLLERGAGIDAKDDYGDTPLTIAVVAKEVEAAKLLIERGADTSLGNGHGETPAELARRYGPNEMVALFNAIAARTAIMDTLAGVLKRQP